MSYVKSENKANKVYYPELNWLRGIAIILVLLGHSIIAYPIDITKIHWCVLLHDYIYSFHMPLFFALSGIYYGFSSKRSYKLFIANKFKRLFIPYLFGNLIMIFAKIAFSSLVNRKITDFTGTILNVILSGGQLWFLYVLFIIFVIFPLIEKLSKETNGFVIGVFILLPQVFGIKFNYFELGSVFYHLIYFYFGFVIAPYYKEIRERSNNNYLLLLAGFVFALVGSTNIMTNNLVHTVLPFAGIIFSFLLISRMGQFFNKLLSLYGAYSLQIYILDGFILVLTRYILVCILKVYDPLLIVTIIFITKISVALLIAHKICSKFAITRFALGYIKK